MPRILSNALRNLRQSPRPARKPLRPRQTEEPRNLPASRATLWSALFIAIFGAALWLGLLAILSFSSDF